MQAYIKIWTLGDFLFEFCTLNRVFLPSFYINSELKYCLSSINQSCHVMSAWIWGQHLKSFKKINTYHETRTMHSISVIQYDVSKIWDALATAVYCPDFVSSYDQTFSHSCAMVVRGAAMSALLTWDLHKIKWNLFIPH